MTQRNRLRTTPVVPAALAAALAAVAIVAAVSTSCTPASRYHEPHLALAGTNAPGVDSTAAALAGDWTGQYDAPFYDRRGALRLSLRRVARVSDGAVTSTVAGTATFAGPSAPVAVDSAHVGRGRVVLFFAPFADQESAATVQLRLDGRLAADTLGGRLRADAAATVAPEHRGGWRVVRVTGATTAARAP